MLLGIPPLLGPDLLHALRAMGHGDEIALVDGNYPAAEHARRLIRADGIDLLTMLEAILTVLPVEWAARASQDNDPARHGPVHESIDRLCGRDPHKIKVRPLSGDELYPRIRSCFAVVATSEMQVYANVILRKGTLPAAKKA